MNPTAVQWFGALPTELQLAVMLGVSAGVAMIAAIVGYRWLLSPQLSAIRDQVTPPVDPTAVVGGRVPSLSELIIGRLEKIEKRHDELEREHANYRQSVRESEGDLQKQIHSLEVSLKEGLAEIKGTLRAAGLRRALEDMEK